MIDQLKFNKINPWWFRLIAICAIGFPLFSTAPMEFFQNFYASTFAMTDVIGKIASLATITIIMWLVCLFNLGSRKLLDYLSASFSLALTTALLGAAFRAILPESMVGLEKEYQFKMVRLFYTILMVVPFSLMAINCFSARRMVERMASIKGSRRELGLHLALSLRVFQHVGEVMVRLLDIWKEEHPLLLVPRHYEDCKGINVLTCIFRWVKNSVKNWIFACIILTFEPIPVMVEEIEQVAFRGENHENK